MMCCKLSQASILHLGIPFAIDDSKWTLSADDLLAAQTKSKAHQEESRGQGR